jgi:hypothetical protein
VQDDYSLYGHVFEHGTWWLPNSIDKPVRGDLEYDGERVRLNLFGVFPGTETFHVQAQLPAILGRCGNEDVTLFDCRLGKQDNIHSISMTTEWRPAVAVLGLHAASYEESLFDEAHVRFTGLEEWIGDQPFSEPAREELADPLVTFRVEHRHAEPRRFDVQSLGGRIGLTATCMQHGAGYERKLEHRSYVSVVPCEPQNLDWYIRTQNQLQRMLCFFADSSVQTLSLRVFQRGDSEFVQRNGCVLWPAFQGKDNTERLRRGMLITYRDLESRFEEVLHLWFANADRLKHVYNLFFAATQREMIYLEQDFLQLAQALEVFSRVVNGGKYLPQLEYDEIASQLQSSIPPETKSSLKQSLKSRIKFGNEFSLRKRITEILRGLETETTRMVTNDAATFVSRIVDTRNYLVHLDDDSRGNPFANEELFRAMELLRALIMVLLMRELKFSESDVRRIVGRSSLLRHRT